MTTDKDGKEPSKEPSVEELITFFRPILAPHIVGDRLSIPGRDAYVLSYVAGGTDSRWTNGQLEPNSKRN